jgi:ribose transport system permease protein
MTTETVTPSQTPTGEQGDGEGRSGGWQRRLLGRMPDPGWSLRSGGILIPFVILFIVLSASSSSFFQTRNLLNILDQQSAYLMAAGAGTLVLISGGLDLSVGATYSLAAVIMGQLGQQHGVVVSSLLALVVGLFIGLVNGFISTVGRINSLIATLAMSFIVSGVGLRITSGNLIVLTSKPSFAKIAQTHFLTIRTSIWIALVALVILGVVLSRSTLGRYLYAAGGNPEAARLAGVRVTGVRITAFAASGLFAALAGVVDTSRVLSAQSTTDSQWAFTVLAGIVVGGTSIMGGEGAIWRTVVGVLFIALVGNGFDLLGVNPLYQQIALGVILLLAVGLDALSRSVRRT